MLSSDLQEDILNFATDEDIQAITSKETLLFSDKVTKINRFGMQQDRNIVITGNAIYSLKEKSLQRRLEIAKLKGITTSKQSNEFVFHGNEEEYDYLYISPNKKKIIYLVEKAFEGLTGTELLFANLEIPHLKNVVTKKAEKKKNPKFSRMDDSELSDIKEYIRKECHFARNNSSFLSDDELENPNPMAGKRMSIWDKVTNDIDIIEGEERIIDINSIKLIKCEYEDLEFISVIGKGKYCITYLANLKETNKLFAVKIAFKSDLITNDFIYNLNTEKKILVSKKVTTGNNFIPQLKFIFQTPDRVFMGFPFYQGGDLYTYLLLHNTIPEKDVIQIVAQIVECIEKLHMYDIIYRNIKLENIMFDSKGFIKLVDFTKSFIMQNKEELATSFIGTDNYLAPEIIEGTGQTKAVDWWMLGVLTYELLFGKSPFESQYYERVYDLICFSEIHFSNDVSLSDDMKDFIQKLLEKNPEERLGAKGVDEIKKHPIFRDVDFNAINTLNFQPFYSPKFTSPTDISNFEKEITEMDLHSNPLTGNEMCIIKDSRNLFKWIN